MELAPFGKIAYRPATMARNIVIYQDDGVGDFGLRALKSFFAADHIRLATAADIIDGGILKECHLFVMPGGADLPYCRKLNGAGNAKIRNFVEKGGTYLGICAGAYYACRAIEFHKGRADEICEPRELAFIDAIAVGSLPELAPHYDDTLRTVSAVDLQTSPETEITAYYHGGCKFILNEEVTVHAKYKIEGSPAAIIEKKVGGGCIILSGVHLEISAADIAFYPLEENDNPAALDAIASSLKNSHQFLRTLLENKTS